MVRSRILGLFWAFFWLFLFVGCAEIPVYDYGVEGNPDRATLKSLLGQSEGEVRSKLRTPQYALSRANEIYLIYENWVSVRAKSTIFISMGVPIPIPRPPTVGAASKRAKYCASLTFRDGKLVEFETDTVSKNEVDSLEFLYCPTRFWNDNELKAMTMKFSVNRDCDLSYQEAVLLSADTHIDRFLSCSDSRRAIRWMWTCLAANRGHGPAQAEIAYLNRVGLEPVSKDLVSAYMWYGLASTLNSPLNQSLVVSSMTPEQVKEAKRLVANWKPNLAECEIAVSTKP